MCIRDSLLGDPEVLIFDEPVNGLDPEGIVWIRTLMRSLASEGKTVFVSSHLMAEMALTADHVIVIGRGKLLAEASIDELIQGSSQNFVRVRSLEDAKLDTLVREKGGSSRAEADGALAVTGISAAAIGDLAGTNGIFLHELSPQEVSLEEVYMEMCIRDSTMPVNVPTWVPPSTRPCQKPRPGHACRSAMPRKKTPPRVVTTRPSRGVAYARSGSATRRPPTQ